MDKHETVRYKHSTMYKVTRYIHKYYLPPELKSKIFPTDIHGIESCFYDDMTCDPYKKRIPKKLPSCVIHYEDLGIEKRIEGDTVRRVLKATAAYYSDCRAKLTPEETRAALNLN